MTKIQVKKGFQYFLFLIFVTITIFFFVKMGNLNQLDFVRQFYLKMQNSPIDIFLYYGSLFFLFTVIAAALPMPGISMSALLSGALFGFIPGALISSVGIAVGNLIAFLVIRKWFKEKVQIKYSKELIRFNQVTDKHGVLGLFSLRAVLVVPSFLLNALAAITSMSARDFVLMTFLGRFPLSVCYAFAGQELMTITSLEEVLTPKHLSLFLLIALSPWGFKWAIKKKFS
jgi:uncharacterized membrane protein YdjX (TVP38/TMEM64 family)